MSVGQKIAQIGKSNPKIIVVGLVGAAIVTVAGVFTYKKVKAKETQSSDSSFDLSALNCAFSEYIKALQEERLSDSVVENLQSAIDEIENGIGEKTDSVDFEGEQFKSLMTLIRDYTIRLIEGNSELVGGLAIDVPDEKDSSLGALKVCLKAQQAVLKAA